MSLLLRAARRVDAAEVAADAAAAPPPAPRAAARPGQRLTEKQRYTIITRMEDQVRVTTIARELGCCRKAVREVWKRYCARGCPGSGSRSGRPPATSAEDREHIVLASHIDPFSSPRRIRGTLGLEASPRTIDRVLRAHGLFGRIAKAKRKFANAERQARMNFARANIGTDWNQALFSDEKCFYGKGYCGQTTVRRPVGMADAPEYIVHRLAHPVKVNVWGCFAASGQGFIHIFNQSLDSPYLKKILDDNLIASAQRLFKPPLRPDFKLLHDNDPKFKSNLVQTALHNKGITCLDFPAYSPDLNPIENLWATMQRKVNKMDCSTMESLQDSIAEAWRKLNKPHMRNLALSMPRRCAAVLAREGHHTRW